MDIEDYADYRAGFLAIVGRPNVGKSTLANAMVGQKIAITSNRPETTRHNVRGVAHRPNAQLVLLDTPGLHRPRTLLGKRLNDMAREGIADADAIIFCLPADQQIGPGDRFIAKELKDLKIPVIAVVTKADLVSADQLAKALVDVDKLALWQAIIPLSAKLGRLGDLFDVVVPLMPKSPPLYPQNQISDESVEKMIAELVREAALEGVRDELPHSIAVVVDEIIFANDVGEGQSLQLGYGIFANQNQIGHDRSDRGNSCKAQKAKSIQVVASGDSANNQQHVSIAKQSELRNHLVHATEQKLDVHVNIYVERPTQRAIMIGKGGSHIRKVRIKARKQIQHLLGCPVNLDLHIRVAKNWQSNTKLMGRLGF